MHILLGTKRHQEEPVALRARVAKRSKDTNHFSRQGLILRRLLKRNACPHTNVSIEAIACDQISSPKPTTTAASTTTMLVPPTALSTPVASLRLDARYLLAL